MSSTIRQKVAGIASRIASARQRMGSPAVGNVDFGDLRRTTPVSRVFGFDRGTPVDRHYIEAFIADNSERIRGRVMEIGDREYTIRFGGDRVTKSDVLHFSEGSAGATIVADLTDARSIADDSFDCVIITQTLQFTYRMEAMVAELGRILVPGGSVLCTVPGISQVSRYDMDRWGDYWRLTDRSARELFETAFSPASVEVTSYGNVLSATALLHGLATSELTEQELDAFDRDYQVIVAIRATKA